MSGALRAWTGLGVCLGALLALSAPAAATQIVDPDCDGSPYPNNFQIYGFSTDTPDSHRSGDSSSLRSGGLACGTTLQTGVTDCGTYPQGVDSLNVGLEVSVPEGVEANRTDTLSDGSYAGTATGRTAICYYYGFLGYSAQIIGGTATVRTVQDPYGTDCPEDAVACYKGAATYCTPLGCPTGYSYTWVTQASDGALTMTTGPVRVPNSPVWILGIGFTQFGVNLCGHAGSPGTSQCGDAAHPWLMRNGSASAPSCLNGKGYFGATVTNYAGWTTNPARSCVQWLPQPQTLTEPACDAHDNSFAAFDLALDTPDSHTEHAVSSLSASVLACGAQITNATGSYDSNGAKTLNDRFDLEMPKGVAVGAQATLADGAYAGTGRIDALTWDDFAYYPRFAADVPIQLTVDRSASTDCPAAALVCYRAATTGGDISGHMWIWVSDDAGKATLTIGKLYNDTYSASPAGITKIDGVTICGYAGAVGGTSCGGAGQPFLLKNGDASGDCNGNGIYTLTIANRDGQQTAPASYRVDWEQSTPGSKKKCKHVDIGPDAVPKGGP